MSKWKNRDKGLLAVMVLVVGMMSAAPRAHAYLDPGTGSFLLQMLVAAVVGCAVFLKTFWTRLVSFFSRFRSGSGKKA